MPAKRANRREGGARGKYMGECFIQEITRSRERRKNAAKNGKREKSSPDRIRDIKGEPGGKRSLLQARLR